MTTGRTPPAIFPANGDTGMWLRFILFPDPYGV